MICQSCKEKNKNIISGQAYTTYICGQCDNAYVHHNTNVPKICLYCSNREKVCQYCGKDMGNENRS